MCRVVSVYAVEALPEIPPEVVPAELTQEQQVAEGTMEMETEVVVGSPGIVIYYEPSDVILLASLCEVESRGCTDPDQIASDCWTVLNRVDSPAFPNTIREVVYAPNQFAASGIRAGVEERRPDMVAIANDVLGRWNAEKNGLLLPHILSSGRTIPPDCVYFWGDGKRNHFNNGVTEHILDTENSPYK